MQVLGLHAMYCRDVARTCFRLECRLRMQSEHATIKPYQDSELQLALDRVQTLDSISVDELASSI